MNDLDLWNLMKLYLQNYGTEASVVEKRRDLILFVGFLAERPHVGAQPKLKHWTQAATAAFRDAELRRGMSPATVVRRLATLNHFGRLLGERFGMRNPCEGVKRPRISRRTPIEYSAKQLELFRDSLLFPKCQFQALRNLTQFNVQLATAVRINEVRQWEMKQLDLENRKVWGVRCKGGKFRDVHLPAHILPDITNYLAERAKLTGMTDGPVWVTEYRGRWKKQSYESIQYNFSKAGRLVDDTLRSH